MSASSTAQPARSSVDAATHEQLGRIIEAYTQVTERLQSSHDRLQAEVRRLREELASTNAQLQRSKRLSALGEMAAGIAHEVRNPLAAIQLYAGMIGDDLLAGPGCPQSAIENARKISAAVHGLNGVVNDVLTFARELEPQRQTVDAATLFDRVVEAHRPAIEQANVTVRRDERDADESVTLDADPQLLHQALLNLVRNAVEATSGSNGRRVLTLSARRDGADAVLSVRDTGPGVSEDVIERIFNPFFTTRNTGTGLGLAIVHRIADVHGGAIFVSNEPDAGGAAFELTLPVKTSGERHSTVGEDATGNGMMQIDMDVEAAA